MSVAKRKISHVTAIAFRVTVIFISVSMLGQMLGCGQSWTRTTHVSEIINGYRLEIGEGKETEQDGTEFRLLTVAYYDSPALMYSVGQYRIPRDASPIFEIVTEGDLTCVYDQNNLGFLTIIDTTSREYFVTSTISKTGGESPTEFELWKRRYAKIKDAHPDLPYSNYFEPSEN